jgi:hypothetical protein
MVRGVRGQHIHRTAHLAHLHRIGSREFWVPGWRQVGFFLLLVLLGLGAWVLRVAAAPSFNPPGFLDEAFDTGVILYALLALAAGFVLPKGFYMWGVAVVLTPRQRSPAPVSGHGIGCGYFRSLRTQRKVPARIP